MLRGSPDRLPVRDLHLKPHALGRCPSQETAGRLRRYDRDVEGLLLHLEPAGVQPGQDEQVGEQRVHPVDLGELVLDYLPVLRVRRVALHHLRVDFDERERGL